MAEENWKPFWPRGEKTACVEVKTSDLQMQAKPGCEQPCKWLMKERLSWLKAPEPQTPPSSPAHFILSSTFHNKLSLFLSLFVCPWSILCSRNQERRCLLGAVWTLIHTYNTRRQGCENGPWTSSYWPQIWLCTGTLSAHRRWSMREWALSPLPCGFKAHTEQNRNSKVTTSPSTCRLKASTSQGGHDTLTSSAPWIIFCSSRSFNFSLQLIASPISGPLFIWKILTPWVISLWWDEEGNELQLSPRCLSTILLTLSLCILHTAIGQKKVLHVIVMCWGRGSCVLWESLI